MTTVINKRNLSLEDNSYSKTSHSEHLLILNGSRSDRAVFAEIAPL